MITRAQIKYEIWLRLNKLPSNPGFYTDAKLNSVVQEATDYVATEQHLADEGFSHKIGYLNTISGQVSLVIPFDYAMILEVSYLVGSLYIPMAYDQTWGDVKWAAASSGQQTYPSRYKLVDNMFYFTPPIGIGAVNAIQLEYMAYPRRMQLDSDVLGAQMDRAMFWFIVYKSCNLLAGQLASQDIKAEWGSNEAIWGSKMVQMVNMRTRQIIPIREFEG